MRNSRVIPSIAMVALLWLLSFPAAAEVVVLEAQSYLDQWALYGSSHGPCGGANWSHEVAEGPTFDLQATGYNDGSCIESNWSARCDGGGLYYSGSWSTVSEGQLGWWVDLDFQISALISLATPTRISAVRTVGGVYSSALHSVFLTLPDGITDNLLGLDSTVNSAERILSAGTYRITFSLVSRGNWSAPSDYNGVVEVNWGNPVGQSVTTWGEMKSMYHAVR